MIEPSTREAGEPVDLIELLADLGPVPYDRFVEICLYHPTGGYYHQTGRQGRRGDYVTAVTVGPTFGRVVARAVMARQSPDSPPIVMELGAGTGDLMEDMTGEWRRMGVTGVTYLAVEAGEIPRKILKERMAGLGDVLGGGVVLEPSELETSERVEHLTVVANEFFDALPFKRIEKTDDGIRERLVTVENRGLVEIIGELIPPPENSRLFSLLSEAPLGTVLEYCPGETRWADRLFSLMATGQVLVFDYGHPHRFLVGGAFPQGTARGFLKHRLVDPLLYPGKADITRTVNWDLLTEVFRDAGFRCLPVRPQTEFLIDEGLISVLEESTDPDRARAKHLLHPQGIGANYGVLEAVRS